MWRMRKESQPLSEPMSWLPISFVPVLLLTVSSVLPSIQSLTPLTPILHVRLACWARQFLMHWKFTPWSGPVLTGGPGEIGALGAHGSFHTTRI